MDAFVWDQNFITGLPDVDRQHHGLVDLFNELNQSLFSGSDTSAKDLEGIFDRLLAYAAMHFEDEEALMVNKGLDARHIQAHHHNGYEREHWLDVVWLCRACHNDTHRSPSVVVAESDAERDTGQADAAEGPV